MNSRVALITFLDGGGGQPDNTLPGGGWSGNYPSQGLPSPGYPTGGPVFPGRPVDPGYGQGGSGNYPSTQPIPGQPPRPIQLPVFPSDPTKPTPPSGPATKPIEPGDEFKLKCTMFGLALVRIKLGSGETLPVEPEPTPTT